MSIVRATRKKQYYTLPNATIDDDRLSWEARGLLVYLLSKPDKWEVQIKDLVNRTKKAIGKSAGRDKVYSILKELKVAGYVYVEFSREGGSFVGVEYEVSEIPDLEAGAEFLRTLEEKARQPFTDLTETVGAFTDSPYTAQPLTGKPETLDKTERAISTEKAVKNTSAYEQPENYPQNHRSRTYAVWYAYAEAYHERYKSWPLYNRTVAGQVGKLVDRVGDRAPALATYYVTQEHAVSITAKCHPVGALLLDCEGYATKADCAKRSESRAIKVKQAVDLALQAAPAQPQQEVATSEVSAPAQSGQEALRVLKASVGSRSLPRRSASHSAGGAL